MLCRPEQFNQSFPILIVQINASERVNLSENDTVSIRFDLLEVAIYLLYLAAIAVIYLIFYCKINFV